MINNFKIIQSKWWLVLLLPILLLFIPVVDFSMDNSTVLYDENRQLLGALVSQDEQWRFSKIDSIPQNVQLSVIQFEDRYFFKHPGINPISLLKAAWMNARAGKILSGGSTITMQVVRLSRKNKARSYIQKCIEIILAIRLELAKSKEEILIMYLSNAPYGGNIVGIEAASWRYFGRDPHHLSWSEASLLAVLPNAPSLMHPGKNRQLLLKKRNRLLKRLSDHSKIDKSTYELSLLEEIPQKPMPLPQVATHLLQRVKSEQGGKSIHSTINGNFQKTLNEIVATHHNHLRHNNIMNLAAIIIKVESCEIKAYVGNVAGLHQAYAPNVDIIQAPRSSGSTLKPILYAAMLEDGLITPKAIIPDIPTHFKGFTPRNFNLENEGAVPANEVIVRSLNVPSVLMLKQYGYPAFHHLLKKCGFSTLNRSSDHYGLSLILGGGEVTLNDLVSVYASFANQLSYPNRPHSTISYVSDNPGNTSVPKNIIGSASLFTMVETLKQLNRPDQESGWKYFESTQPIAWKTGTSFGFRDAWAVGFTSDYVVGVWAGNADGTGRAGLTGVKCAAPVLFDVFNRLDVAEQWFQEPEKGLVTIRVCEQSGFRAGLNCSKTDTIRVPEKCAFSPVCTYHHILHLNESGEYRVSSNCYPVVKMKTITRFKLPAVMEYFYQQKHPEYKIAPDWLSACQPHSEAVLSFIYPGNDPYLYVPKDFGNVKGSVVFEVVSRMESQELFWHMDGAYLGKTFFKHQMALSPSVGNHSVTVTDEDGNSVNKQFFVKEIED